MRSFFLSVYILAIERMGNLYWSEYRTTPLLIWSGVNNFRSDPDQGLCLAELGHIYSPFPYLVQCQWLRFQPDVIRRHVACVVCVSFHRVRGGVRERRAHLPVSASPVSELYMEAGNVLSCLSSRRQVNVLLWSYHSISFIIIFDSDIQILRTIVLYE